MIIEAVYHGPGMGTPQQYMLEILLIVFGAFLLGYLFRHFLNDKHKKKIKALKHEIEEQKSNIKADNSDEYQKQIQALEHKVNHLNQTLSNTIADKMKLQHELNELKVIPKAEEPKAEIKVLADKVDDLTKIEGIGPKIAQLLKDASINSYEKLISTSLDEIKNALSKGGPTYAVHDPSTWGEQAKLAGNGEWEKLSVLQKNLKGGKRKSK